MELQELISRGRMLFSGAEKRLRVYELVNGKRTAKDIARATRRSHSSVSQDLQKMRDLGLIQTKSNNEGVGIKKEGGLIAEKVPLLRHVPQSYFSDPVKAKKRMPKPSQKTVRRQNRNTTQSLRIPKEAEILDICRNGEDQLYEFKSAGVEMNKIAREVAAFANTRNGGIVFYGVDDDGTISGSDMHRQKIDQSLQNSLRNTVSPALTVRIAEKEVMGYVVILILVPQWNCKDVYQHNGRVLIRRGTNVFSAKPEELKILHVGQYVV